MNKKIIGITICILLLVPILSITTLAEDTDSIPGIREFTRARIFIRGKPDMYSIEGPGYILAILIIPLLINVKIDLEFRMEFSPKPPNLIVNGARQTIEGPVTATIENFTGYGPAIFSPLTPTFWLMIWGLMFIGIGDITITPLN